ncbi:MAG: prolipoprotein diacylglyceryl transferase [Gammaproteobacteria bacterium]|nr:prolipoprotein diacylglyceryl transferase [Gammaproteobacteria bacterium]
MNYPDINPIIFSLGPISFRWYGLLYVVAFVVCYSLGRKRLKTHSNLTVQQWNDLLFWGIVGTLLGGRFGFVLFYGFDKFLADPLWAVKVWEGGMSFHGGVIGVATAILLWCKINKTAFLSVSDFVVPVVPIGIGIGRLGNFINTELPGRITESFLGVHFPCHAVSDLNPTCVGDYEELTRHVSSLYQAFVTGVVVFGLLWWFSRKPRDRVVVTGLFFLLYGVGRCFTETFREPDVALGFIAGDWLTMGQLLSIPMILIGGLLLIPTVNQYLTGRSKE